MIVVSNASPLIILARLDLFGLPQRLFNRIRITRQVWDEVVVRGAGFPGSEETRIAGWIEVAYLADPAQLAVWQSQYSLGAGELSTILLAKEIQAQTALIDERRARLLAKSENIPVLGTVGLLELGYRRGEIADLRLVYQGMCAEGVRIDPLILNRSLAGFNLPPI
ncbi:MAG: DUF3368 domain-containing protein [Acidobacteria bacterium]|nr:DUF3368 domain-containing protein [Acidobacteriota bacterium]MCW5968290.1 hypothetical protein [Blastocatellales bacterium]